MSDFERTVSGLRSVTPAEIDQGIRRARQLRSEAFMRMLASANPFSSKRR